MAETVSTNQFKNGMHVELDGQVWRIVEFQHVKPGKGGAFVRTKLKSLDTGAVVDKTFRAGEKMPRIRTETKNVQYLYDAGDEVVFMDEETFEQLTLPRGDVEDELDFLQPSATVQILMVDGSPSGVAAPGVGRARRRRDGARRPGRHGLERDEAGDARDGRGRAGAALRQRRRSHQGRHARAPLHLPGVEARHAAARRHDDPASLAGAARRPRLRARAATSSPRMLDKAGFACLEVSGGGCFDSAVRRGVESPWERIRRSARAARRRSGWRCAAASSSARGRFRRDIVRRFVASAAGSGIDVFRLHDPLNDLANLREAADAIRDAGKELSVGLVHSPGPTGETEVLLERAHQLDELGASRVLIHDPAGSLDPAQARELVERVGEASGLPVGLHCQGSGGVGARGRDRGGAGGGGRGSPCALYPVALSLHRVSAEALTQSLAGVGLDTGVDVDELWRGSELVDDALGDEPVPPLSPRVAVRAAEHALPAGLVAELEAQPARARRRRPARRGARGAATPSARECGWPPLASPIGQVLGSQALLHVLSAQRWHFVVDELRDLVEGRYGTPPGEIDPTVRRAVQLLGDGLDEPEEPPEELDELREDAEGLAASEEELLLLALFGEEAEPLLRSIRVARAPGRVRRPGSAPGEAERLREIIRVVQESGIGEVTIEEGEMRVTVRRSDERPTVPMVPRRDRPRRCTRSPTAAARAADDDVIRIESPMVGTFYRAPQPGAPPFVEEGDTVDARADALHPRGDEAHERGEGRVRGDRPARSASRTPRRCSTATSCSSSSR